MTQAMSDRAARPTFTFWIVFCVAALVAFGAAVGNLADPLLMYDDYPALLTKPDRFWSKTLSEGRWVNYVWHLREVQTPSWVNFAAYQLMIAGLAALIAMMAIKPPDRVFYGGLAAALIVVSPASVALSFWASTLLPGLALCVAYGSWHIRLFL